MEGAVEGVRAAAKSTTAQLDSQSAAQRLWLAGQEMRIRAEFAPQFQHGQYFLPRLLEMSKITEDVAHHVAHVRFHLAVCEGL